MNITVREKNKGFQAIVSYKVNGKWKQKSKQGFDKKREAEKWAKNLMFELMKDKKDNIVDTNEITLGELRDAFIENQKYRIKSSTLRSQKFSLVILDEIKDWKVSKIKPYEMSNFFINLRTKTGKNFTYSIQTTTSMFNFAIKEMKIIRDNPCSQSRQLKKITEDNRIKYIDKELYTEILNSIKSPTQKLFVEILYSTGMRASEVNGLNIRSVFPDRIKVEQQLYNHKLTSLKTKNSYRSVPITHELYKKITSCPIIDISGQIFPKKVYLLYLSKFNVSPHCFRHTYATNLVALKINLMEAATIVGDTLDTFISTYVHSTEDEQEKAFDLIRKTI